MDGKNTPGSYSALVVFETQEAFVGSHYMLPQYRMGLDVRQGMPGLWGLLYIDIVIMQNHVHIHYKAHKICCRFDICIANSVVASVNRAAKCHDMTLQGQG